MLPMFLAVVDQTIVATALPAIAAATGEVEHASWVVVSYLVAATIAAPIYGRLGDAFGRRGMMFVALAISLAASLFCTVAPTLELLTLGRLLQGIGGGGLMTLSQAMIGEAVPPRERARYQGYIAAVAVTANTFGPVAGGYLTEHFGWRSIFAINIPIGLVALALTFRLPNRAPANDEWKADPFGFMYFTLFVGTTLLALQQLQHARMDALPLALAMLGVGILALGLLVRHENRTASPLIPLGLLRMPAIWRSDAMAACHGGALVSLITFMPVFLEVVRGASPSETGLILVPLTIGIGTGSLVTGRLVSRTGRTTIFPVTGLILVTANLAALALWAPDLNNAALGALLLWNGLFMGTVMGVVQVTVQSAAGAAHLGEAAASVQFSRSIGAAFGTAMVATVLFAFLAMRNPDAARVFAIMVEHGQAPALDVAQRAAIRADIVDAFRAGFMLMALFTAVGCVLALTNPMRKI
jgi:EmrB/QacA subfamily drug resistance transporter